MKIHIVQAEERTSDIANEYSVTEESIKTNNEIRDIPPAEGEELLILTPTRTHTIKRDDTPEKIALRFGIRKNDLYALNPNIITRGMIPGERITLKYDERTHGMVVANGYFYKGCSSDDLMRVLPYLTYITFANAIATDNGISETFDVSEALDIVQKNEKVPLVRIYDKCRSRYKESETLDSFCDKIISLAKKRGYKGVVLNSSGVKDTDEYSAFLVEMRKRMIGCDLILLTEIDEEAPIEFGEYADGSILSYSKYVIDAPPSFDEGEKEIFSDFACRGESAKTFIELPALARVNGEFLSTSEATDIARRSRCKITQNDSTLLSSFEKGGQGKFTFTSLKNIKAILELIYEYGFMGISFDIMRTPLSHLMMYNSMFKTTTYTNVRSPEGCSRGSAM